MAYALITGAGKGIGKALAHELASKGYNILVVSRTESDLLNVCENIQREHNVQALYFVADLSEEGSAMRVYQWIESLAIDIEVLVNNAGYGLSGNFTNEGLDSLTNMIRLNTQTLISFTHIFLPHLLERKQAYILNIASTAAYQAIPGLATYAATKSFVLSFSRGLSKELKKGPVSVTCVCPGPTETAFMERARLSPKGAEMTGKVQMQPQQVAAIAVNAMLKKKPEVIPGFQNKAAAFFSWLLPKNAVEQIAGRLIKSVT